MAAFHEAPGAHQKPQLRRTKIAVSYQAGLLTTNRLRVSWKEPGLRVPQSCVETTPADSRHRCAPASSWRIRARRRRLSQRIWGSAAAGLGPWRWSLGSFGFPPALPRPPTSVSEPGSRLTAEHAGVSVRPARDASPDGPDGMVWGVRRIGLRGSWVGVTGRPPRRRLLRGGGAGV
jgi:hypothetical protein